MCPNFVIFGRREIGELVLCYLTKNTFSPDSPVVATEAVADRAQNLLGPAPDNVLMTSFPERSYSTVYTTGLSCVTTTAVEICQKLKGLAYLIDNFSSSFRAYFLNFIHLRQRRGRPPCRKPFQNPLFHK